jgi:hypothetical protein
VRKKNVKTKQIVSSQAVLTMAVFWCFFRIVTFVVAVVADVAVVV